MDTYPLKRKAAAVESSSDSKPCIQASNTNKKRKLTPHAGNQRKPVTGPSQSFPQAPRRSARIRNFGLKAGPTAQKTSAKDPPPVIKIPDALTMKAERDTESASLQPNFMMTRTSLLARFPASHFDRCDRILTKGYWSLPAERKMRTKNAAFISRMASKSGLPTEELLVFQLLAKRFACTPADLFRYGLKPPPGSPAPALASWCARLITVLAHPIWEGRVALVRWALQAAVGLRFARSGHPPPLCPPYSHVEPPFVAQALVWARARGDDEAYERAQMSRWLFTSTVPVGVWRLVEEKMYLLRREADYKGRDESVFFYLREQDLDLVSDALMAMVGDSDEEFADPEWYIGEFLDELEERGDGGLDAQWMARLKEEWLFSAIRERAVRDAMEKARQGDMLLDIPPFDPDPLYHLNKGREVMRSQLASYDGSLKGMPAAMLWCWLDGAA